MEEKNKKNITYRRITSGKARADKVLTPIFKIIPRISAFLLTLVIMCQFGWNLYSYCMIAPEHTHDYFFVNSDNLKHWKQCECGEIIDAAEHIFSGDLSDKYHWEYCDCGRVREYTNHDFAAWNIITEPTEISEGLKDSTCEVCKYHTSATIDQLKHEHSYSDKWVWDENDHWLECRCGNKSEVSAHVHKTWKTTQEPTIYTTGTRESVCEGCKFVKIEVLAPLEHTCSFDSEWKTDENSHWLLCYCGQKGNSASHSYGNWETIKAATITSTGEEKRSCTVCGFTQTQIIEKIPHTHSYTKVWKNNQKEHWYQCSCGEKTGVASHSFGSWVTITPATITSEGKKQRTCNYCKYIEIATIEKIPHTHSYTSVWFNDETGHWNQCSSCREKVNSSSHTYGSWTVLKAPTSTEPGSKRRICSVCNYWHIEEIPVN